MFLPAPLWYHRFSLAAPHIKGFQESASVKGRLPNGHERILGPDRSQIYQRLKNQNLGNHAVPEEGQFGERIEESKPYEFGDPFHLHMPRTSRNALDREGPGSPVQLKTEDFEIYRSEQITQTATVLMVDQLLATVDAWLVVEDSAGASVLGSKFYLAGTYNAETITLQNDFVESPSQVLQLSLFQDDAPFGGTLGVEDSVLLQDTTGSNIVLMITATVDATIPAVRLAIRCFES